MTFVKNLSFCDVLITTSQNIQLPYETTPRIDHFQSASEQFRDVLLEYIYHADLYVKVRDVWIW